MSTLVAFAKALSDTTRQEMMRHLCCDWLSVNDVVEKLGGAVSQPTVSHHLNVLEDAGLLVRQKKGKRVYCSLRQDTVLACCSQLLEIFAPESGRKGAID